MSLDRSLRTGSTLNRHRNVLTRAERVGRLAERGTFQLDASDPLHLPKVANRKVAAGGKAAAPKKAEGAEGAAAAPAAGAAGGKAAAPAAGAAKGAAAAGKAPAAKGGAAKK